jgi:hypothetical protein
MSISRELSKFIEPGGQLEYDNTTSGLSATTVKSAIDELNTLLGGGNVGSQATFNVYEFTATASQTTFSLSSNHGQGSDITAGAFADGVVYIITSVGTTDFVALYGASSNTVGVTFTATTDPGTGTGTAKVVADYIPGYIKVYLNGVFLSETDYVASDGDNIVLDTGADVGALLSVVVLDSFNIATQLRVLGVDAGAPDNSLVIDSSGNVGVSGWVTATGLVEASDGTNGEMQLGLGTALTTGAGTYDSSVRWNGLAGNLLFSQGAVEKMRITAAGIDVTGTVTADTGEITRLGVGVAAHASAALNITTTDQHIRLNNGSELGVMELDSSGHLNIWAHDDGETINLKTGSGAGNNVLSVVGNNVGIGTSSPSSLLHLSSSAPTLQFSEADVGVQNYIQASGGGFNFFADDTNAASGTKMGFFIDGSERMRINSTGAATFSGTATAAGIIASDNTVQSIGIGINDGAGYINSKSAAGGVMPLAFYTGGTEKARIDSSGNLLVGKTANNITDTGAVIRSTGETFITRSGNPLSLNRLSSDGSVLEIRKDSAVVGNLGVVSSNNLNIHSTSTGHSGLSFGTGIIFPTDNAGDATDNVTDLGSSSYRFNDIYRGGSTISTSDRNMKQDERDLTEAEATVAQACKSLLKAFRFIDAVEKDGDGARIHFGIVAQDLQVAFEAEGLDATNYAMFRPSTYTNENGDEQTRLGVCYENLLAFIIAAI